MQTVKFNVRRNSENICKILEINNKEITLCLDLIDPPLFHSAIIGDHFEEPSMDNNFIATIRLDENIKSDLNSDSTHFPGKKVYQVIERFDTIQKVYHDRTVIKDLLLSDDEIMNDRVKLLHNYITLTKLLKEKDKELAELREKVNGALCTLTYD